MYLVHHIDIKIMKVFSSFCRRMSHPVSNDVHPCCSSVVDVVFFALDRSTHNNFMY